MHGKASGLAHRVGAELYAWSDLLADFGKDPTDRAAIDRLRPTAPRVTWRLRLKQPLVLGIRHQAPLQDLERGGS